MNRNANCDGSHCLSNTGEVRVLPTGGDSNLILCQACFDYEIAWRKERNRELSPDSQFKLPAWTDLQVYGQPVSLDSAEAAIRAAIKAAATETNAVVAEGVKATAAFAEAVMSGTFSFESMPGAPRGSRAFQCQGGNCAVLICEYNDQGRIGYEGALTTVANGKPIIVRLLPLFVQSVYRKVVAARN